MDTTADSLAGGTLNYKAAYTGEYYSATASGVSYTPGAGGSSFTLSGIISGKQVTVNQSAPDMSAKAAYTVKLAGDYTLNFLANTDGTEVGACLGTYTSAYTPAYGCGPRLRVHLHSRRRAEQVHNQRLGHQCLRWRRTS